MDEQELAAIEATHVRDYDYPDGKYCKACGPAYGRWPCAASALLAEVRRLRGVMRAVYEDGIGRPGNRAAAVVEPLYQALGSPRGSLSGGARAECGGR